MFRNYSRISVQWVAFVGVFCATLASAAPDLISYQAFLRDDVGLPADGTYEIELRIFDAETGGTEIWSETHAAVVVDGGIFNLVLGSVSPLDASDFDGPERWMATFVDSEELTPRRQFLSAPYAMRAAVADFALAGGEADSDWVIAGDNVYRLDGLVGIGTDAPSADLHLSGGTGPVNFLIEADKDNTNDSAHPRILMQQDGGLVGAEIGFEQNQNDFRIERYSSNSRTTYLELESASGNIVGNMDIVMGGGVDDYDGASELLQIRAQSDSWYVGVRNELTIDETDFFIGLSSAEDGMFAIRATGDIGIGTTNPGSKLSVVGDVDAESYAATQSLGEIADPGVGGIYADNVVYAWAWVGLSGTLIESFGITSIDHTATGEYTVNLERTFGRTCPVVTVNHASSPHTATALAFDDHVDVLIWEFTGTGPEKRDRNFFVQIMARP